MYITIDLYEEKPAFTDIQHSASSSLSSALPPHLTDLEIDNLTSNMINITLKEIFELDLLNEDLSHTYSDQTSKYLSHILLGIIGVIICIVGIFGNIISIIVLSRQSMHKLSTYAYLIALSVCDAFGLFFTIIVLIQYSIPPGSVMPKWMSTTYPILLVYVYPIVVTSQTLSVWITLAFTIDRYFYVCKPYSCKKFCTRKRSCYIIVFIYILSILYSIPQFFERKYEIVQISSDNFFLFSSLTEFGRSQAYFRIYHLYIYTIFICFIPFVTIAVLNAFLIYNIMKSNKRHRELYIGVFKNRSISYTLVDSTCPPIAKQAKILYDKKGENFCFKTCFTRLKSATINKTSFSNTTYEQETQLNSQNLPPLQELQPLNLQQKQQDDSTTQTPLTPNAKTSQAHVKFQFQQKLSSNQNTKSKDSNTRRTSNETKYIEKAYRNDVTVLLIGLVIVFMICQLPSTILRLITYKNRSIIFDPVYVTLMDISNFLIVLNSTINCVLYVMLGKKFRKEFLRTICPNCYLKKTSTQIYLRRLSYNRQTNNNREHQNGRYQTKEKIRMQ